jgi:hypothetical protein
VVPGLIIKPQWRGTILTFPLPEYNPATHICFVSTNDASVKHATLRRVTTREQILPKASISVLKTERIKNDLHITLKSDTFVHAVHIKEAADDARFDDLWFDMLPGEERTIVWHDAPVNSEKITPLHITGGHQND